MEPEGGQRRLSQERLEVPTQGVRRAHGGAHRGGNTMAGFRLPSPKQAAYWSAG
jgi:hypothetical protein